MESTGVQERAHCQNHQISRQKSKKRYAVSPFLVLVKNEKRKDDEER